MLLVVQGGREGRENRGIDRIDQIDLYDCLILGKWVLALLIAWDIYVEWHHFYKEQSIIQ